MLLLLVFCQLVRRFCTKPYSNIRVYLKWCYHTAHVSRLAVCARTRVYACRCILRALFVLFLCQQRLAGLIFHVLCFALLSQTQCVLPVATGILKLVRTQTHISIYLNHSSAICVWECVMFDRDFKVHKWKSRILLHMLMAVYSRVKWQLCYRQMKKTHV